MAIILKLFVVAGTGSGSVAARNLAKLVDGLGARVEAEVIDIAEQPNLAAQEHIIATPTLLRVAPLPRRKVIGDLSDRETVSTHLGLDKLQDSSPAAPAPKGVVP
jgi:circadian clock protein KaiB